MKNNLLDLNFLNEYFQPKCEIIYHYTTFKSASLIFNRSNGNAVFTATYFKNIENEGSVLINLINSYIENNEISSNHKKIVKEIVDTVDILNEYCIFDCEGNLIIDDNSNLRQYVSSYSIDNNSMYLKEHCGDNNVVSLLKIDTKKVIDSFCNERHEYYIGIMNVIYDINTQKEIVKKFFEEIEMFSDLLYKKFVCAFVNTYSFAFRNESFAKEKEVRVVFYMKSNFNCETKKIDNTKIYYLYAYPKIIISNELQKIIKH